MKLGIGRGFLLACVAWALSVVFACVVGCPQAKAPTARDEARSVVLLVAQGVRVANDACAWWGYAEVTSGDGARVLHARDVLSKCSTESHAAAAWLTLAESTVNTWDAASSGDLACIVSAVAPHVRALRGALQSVGVSIPPVVDDAIEGAIRLLPFVTRGCSVTIAPLALEAPDAGNADAFLDVLPAAECGAFDVLPDGG